MNRKTNVDKDQISGLILRRLDALIAFSLNPVENATIYAQAARLKALNFTNSEIASILGKTATHIRKELSIGRGKQHGRKRNRAKA